MQAFVRIIPWMESFCDEFDNKCRAFIINYTTRSGRASVRNFTTNGEISWWIIPRTTGFCEEFTHKWRDFVMNYTTNSKHLSGILLQMWSCYTSLCKEFYYRKGFHEEFYYIWMKDFVRNNYYYILSGDPPLNYLITWEFSFNNE